MSEAVMRVKLRARYGKHEVLRGVEFALERGEALGLIGASGAGKTTLVMALLGLLRWRGGVATGEVWTGNGNLLEMTEREARRIRGKRVALIPQSPMTALNGAVTLRAHFEEAWKAHAGGGRAALEGRLAELLPEVQLPAEGEFLRRRPGQISVGQAQRVLIALALLHRPEVLIADEPTSALDPVTQAEILGLLGRLNRTHGTALLYISHDLISVLQLCSRVAVLDEGRIEEIIDIERLADASGRATRALTGTLPVPLEVLLGHRRRD